MRATMVLLAASALAGCSLVFPDSSYTGGDAGTDREDAGGIDGGQGDGGQRDGGQGDAGEVDAGDAGALDAGSDDGGPPGDAGGTSGAWPTCGNSMREASVARDARGREVAFGDALFEALFGGTAANGEVGLTADRQVPAAPARVIDIAIATGPGATFLLATADEEGGLHVREIRLAGSVSFGPSYPVVWPSGAPPTSIERIAMRTVGSTTRIAVIGSRAAALDERAWSCTVASAQVTCSSIAITASASELRTAAVFGTMAGAPEPLLLGGAAGAGYVLRPADGTEPIGPRSYSPADRVSGTGGPLVIAPVNGAGDPYAYWMAPSGFTERDLGPRSGPAAAAYLAPDTYVMAQAQFDGPSTSFTLGVRPLLCDATECTCPGEAGSDCAGIAAYSARTVAGRDPRFVELERARDAVLAVVGEGEGPASSSGTEVVLYAFDRATSAPIDLGPGVPSMVLGSGMAAPFVGTLVPEVGMRMALRSSGSEVAVAQAALVDLDSSGTVTREAFVSVLRICGAR